MLSGYYRELRRQGNNTTQQQVFIPDDLFVMPEANRIVLGYFDSQPSLSHIEPMEFADRREQSYSEIQRKLTLRFKRNSN